MSVLGSILSEFDDLPTCGSKCGGRIVHNYGLRNSHVAYATTLSPVLGICNFKADEYSPGFFFFFLNF